MTGVAETYPGVCGGVYIGTPPCILTPDPAVKLGTLLISGVSADVSGAAILPATEAVERLLAGLPGMVNGEGEGAP
jgi:hypothetical protein